MSKNIPEQFETLFASKWVEVRKVGYYSYSHAPWSNGVGVAVLPFRINEGGFYSFLGRFEITPSHGPDTKLVSITGGYDNADEYTIEECMLNELREEGGYDAPSDAVISLGYLRPSKGSDTLQYIFAVNLDHPDAKTCEATSDGTEGEQGSYCEWVSLNDLLESSDPLLHSMYLRMVLGNSNARD